MGLGAFGKMAMAKFAAASPLPMMVRAALVHALSAAELDDLFEREAEGQYLRELTFSNCVNLMGSVVLRFQKSVHAAYQASPEEIGVSVKSVYNKIDGLEPRVCAATTAHSAKKLGPVVESMGGQLAPLVAGYRTRILDGNHLGATQRRIGVLKGCAAGPLPGQALVVLDPAIMMITEVIPCEDAHAQERSMTGEILALAQPSDLWLADRNFCTGRLLFGIAGRKAFFLIRQHAQNVVWKAAGSRNSCGSYERGEVFEQKVTLLHEGKTMAARRITVKLKRDTRDGDREINLLTNLPHSAPAMQLAETYRNRWKLETAFQEMTVDLKCEVNTLGYPRAALFAFCLAAVAYNVLSTAKAALRAAHGHALIEETLSNYYVVDEVTAAYRGMMTILEPELWEPFRDMPAPEFGAVLREWAANLNLRRYTKSKRGPKKPVPPRTQYKHQPHVSTARLLAERKGVGP